MRRSREICLLGALATMVLGPTALAQDTTPHAGMLRFPDVGPTHIVFGYANDLWLVPRAGGMASPLASPDGQELFPRFSPDGKTIVFQGNYEGNRDLYTVPTRGGAPHRVTHHPFPEYPQEWTGDGRILFFQAGRSGLTRQTQLFTVSAEGGLPEALPIPYGATGAISPDGKWLAYTPHSRDTRTWKRYRGGMATDIWLFHLETHEWKPITEWEGTDTMPMWHGSTVYYLSDAGDSHRLNIWAYNVDSGERSQITRFDEYDVKFPSIGPGEDGVGEIVFQNGAGLYLLDLATNQAREVKVTIPGARPKIGEQVVDASRNMASGGISSTGKRAVLEARGDIWTIPAEDGATRQITNTSGVAERLPAWSPDGRWIAYFSDADGEYELYVTQSDGRGETRQVTDGNKTYFFSIEWAPDSEKLVITDKAGNIILVDLESGDEKVVDRDVWASGPDVDWSHDSRWLVYSLPEPSGGTSAIWVYNLETEEKHKLTTGFFNDHHPCFDRKGEYIYYASNREFSSPQYEDLGTTFIYNTTDRLVAVPLTVEDYENPWMIEPDEEEWEEETEDEGEGEEGEDSDEGDEDADDESDEDAEEEGDEGEGDEAPSSPIHGVWNGVATGFAALGMPEDEIEFTLTVIAHADGTFTATSSSMGETSEYDSAEFEEDTGKFRASRSEGGMTVVMEGTLTGDSLKGTWEIVEMGVEGTWEATKSEEEPDVEASEESKEKETVEIVVEGFESRGMQLPVSAGNFASLASNDKGQLLYVRYGGGAAPSVKLIDVRDDEPEEKNVIAGVGGFDISGDGKKLLVAQGGRWGIINASAGQSIGTPLKTSPLRKRVDPREEWEQLFTDAWRRHRDFFYVPNMHGVDWKREYKRYKEMLADAASREDVSFIIGEMIAELNIGHAYYWGGDVEGQPFESVGLLGVAFELAEETGEDGETRRGYRIARKIEGGPWDSDARGPLSQPGVDVHEGDFLIAVNGMAVDPDQDPWAPLVGLAGRHTTLTFASSLVGDEETRNEREVTITPMGSEVGLRYREWVENNRKYVEEKSDGKIGYIFVPNTGIQGQNELFRQFYGQIGKEALLIDERWNGGGQIPTRFIELLNRPRTNYWKRRDGKDWPWPPDSHQGPKAMLINGLAGSGGDMFPWLFRHNDLGALIGTRTWGGLVGISGVPGLIDGGYTAVPTFGFYETDGTWGVEGHGVDPDIRVVDDPAELAKGVDPQLDAAIQHLLHEIEVHGYEPPEPPAPPDRSDMGIREEDK